MVAFWQRRSYSVTKEVEVVLTTAAAAPTPASRVTAAIGLNESLYESMEGKLVLVHCAEQDLVQGREVQQQLRGAGFVADEAGTASGILGWKLRCVTRG